MFAPLFIFLIGAEVKESLRTGRFDWRILQIIPVLILLWVRLKGDTSYYKNTAGQKITFPQVKQSIKELNIFTKVLLFLFIIAGPVTLLISAAQLRELRPSDFFFIAIYLLFITFIAVIGVVVYKAIHKLADEKTESDSNFQ